MSDAYVSPSVQEVCEWKERAAELTRGMTRTELIEFYRKEGEEFKRQFGLELRSRAAGAPERYQGRSLDKNHDTGGSFMKDDLVPDSVAEVCKWKDQAAEETRGMSTQQLIEFYKARADEVQRRWGLRLRSRPASEAGREHDEARVPHSVRGNGDG